MHNWLYRYSNLNTKKEVMINYDDDKEDNSNNKPINEEVKELSLQLEKLSTDYENNLKRLKELSKILRGE